MSAVPTAGLPKRRSTSSASSVPRRGHRPRGRWSRTPRPRGRAGRWSAGRRRTRRPRGPGSRAARRTPALPPPALPWPAYLPPLPRAPDTWHPPSDHRGARQPPPHGAVTFHRGPGRPAVGPQDDRRSVDRLRTGGHRSRTSRSRRHGAEPVTARCSFPPRRERHAGVQTPSTVCAASGHTSTAPRGTGGASHPAASSLGKRDDTRKACGPRCRTVRSAHGRGSLPRTAARLASAGPQLRRAFQGSRRSSSASACVPFSPKRCAQ